MNCLFSGNRHERSYISIYAWVLSIALFMVPDVYAASAGGESGPTNWLDFAWKIINMVVLIGFLYWLLAKKIKEFFVSRREGIKMALEQARIAKEEAEQRYKEYSEKLEKATEEIAAISDMIKAQGVAEKERIVEDARKAAEKIKEDTQARFEQELKQAGNLLRAEAVKLSVEMAEELLKRNIKATDHDAMVKEYLDKVVSKH
jgi:F-type H+-transporting ATPase subunit b